jgi:hypothetical protein
MKRAIYGPYTTVILSVTTVYVVVNGSARLVYGGRNDGPGLNYIFREQIQFKTFICRVAENSMASPNI